MTLSKHNLKQIAGADRRRAKIAKLRKLNTTWTKIGEIMGISRQRVQQIWDGRRT